MSISEVNRMPVVEAEVGEPSPASSILLQDVAAFSQDEVSASLTRSLALCTTQALPLIGTPLIGTEYGEEGRNELLVTREHHTKVGQAYQMA